LAICLSGLLAARAGAVGFVPGSFHYKLHATVPVRTVEEEFPPFQRAPDGGALIAAPSVAQAGEHADLTVTSGLKVSDSEAVLDGTEIPQEVVAELPPGPLVELGATPPCTRAQFLASVAETPGGCPPASQVGIANAIFGGALTNRSIPLYKLAPAHGHLITFGFPYELVFQRAGVQMNLDLRADGDYGLTLSSRQVSLNKFVPAPFLTVWGVPAAPAHDFERWDPQTLRWGASLTGPQLPVIANAADCEAGTREARARLRYWSAPETWLPEDPEDPAYRSLVPAPEGCERLVFAPAAELSPSAGRGSEPTGLDLRLQLPRNLDPAGLEAPPLAAAALALPAGMSVNPGVADGLAGCTPEQVGLEAGGTPAAPARFGAGEAHCPAAAKIGEGRVETPIAEAPIEADVFLATPFRNPFHSPLALYLVLPGPGFTAKLAVEVEADPQSGRLRAKIDSLPPLPMTAAELHLDGGPRAPLAPPKGCGEGSTELALTPWSAPASGPPARIVSSYAYSDGCGGTPPQLLAGSSEAIAGSRSPFVLHLRGSEIGAFSISLPPGLAPGVRGVDRCGTAEIARAEARQAPGGGATERRDPSCPAGSRVGSLRFGVGSGPSPLTVAGGLYLAGPYGGSPVSLVAITPALAGGSESDPLFDLGTVVERVALAVDPRSGALSARVGPPPRRIGGIPLGIESIEAIVDRPGFMRNPTRCADMVVAARVEGVAAGPATPDTAFRVNGCGDLPFAPQLQAGLGGGRHLALRIGLRAKPGEAAIAAARLLVPDVGLFHPGRRRGEIGRASAWSDLFDRHLSGPVYLRPRPPGPPELDLALGPERELEIAGRVLRRPSGVRIDLTRLPDVGLTKLAVHLRGGQRGLLVGSGDRCGPRGTATARLFTYGGTVRSTRELLGSPCPASRRRPGPDRKIVKGTEE
jgi:hypothetical protein